MQRVCVVVAVVRDNRTDRFYDNDQVDGTHPACGVSGSAFEVLPLYVQEALAATVSWCKSEKDRDSP